MAEPAHALSQTHTLLYIDHKDEADLRELGELRRLEMHNRGTFNATVLRGSCHFV